MGRSPPPTLPSPTLMLPDHDLARKYQTMFERAGRDLAECRAQIANQEKLLRSQEQIINALNETVQGLLGTNKIMGEMIRRGQAK